MLIRNLILAISVLITINTFSQTINISGRVSDLLTTEFISNAKVIVQNQNEGIHDSTFTSNFGGWSYSFIPTGISDHRVIPEMFTVSQNYPNPFNPSTIIKFSLSAQSQVEIAIHDILGRLIDKKSNFLVPGEYEFTWDANGSAGVYLYTVSSNDFSITKKMILLDGGNGTGLSRIRNSGNQSLIKSSNLTGTDLQIVISKFGYISDTLNVTVNGNEYFETELNTVHHSYILADLHNDVLEIMVDNPDYHLKDYHSYNHTDIPRMKIGGVKIQFFAVWVNPSTYLNEAFSRANEMIDIFEYEMFLSSEDIGQARNYQQAQNLLNQNKIAAVLAVEGGHAIENNMDNLYSLYDSGARYMTITWNNSTDWAVSAQDTRSTSVGLSEFGREVIEAMDSLGIIIDISHTGIQTIKDILEITENPIIATHSGVRAILNHTRNLFDDQIEDIAESGGVIGVVFYPPFLGSNSSTVDISTVVDHINYIVNLVGIDFAAIGSDFDGIGNNTVNGLENTSKFPDLTLALLENGYTNLEVKKILGDNFIRVFKEVCK